MDGERVVAHGRRAWWARNAKMKQTLSRLNSSQRSRAASPEAEVKQLYGETTVDSLVHTAGFYKHHAVVN